MQEKIKFYIIVPIYNVAPYLRKCLDSILAQSYVHFEAILVDDGSSDGSGNIAQEYVSKDSRFTLIWQENQGSSVARNKGLELVAQKCHLAPPQLESGSKNNKSYIYFVDSDDFLESNALLYVAEKLGTQKSEVFVASAIYACDEQGSPIAFSYRVFAEHIKGYYTPLRLLQALNKQTLIATTWAFIVKADFLFQAHIEFIPYIIHQDVPFCTQIAMEAQSIFVDNAHIYNYRLRAGSVMRTPPSRARYIKEATSSFEILKAFVKLEEKARLGQEVEIADFYRTLCYTNMKELLQRLQFVGYVDELKPYKKQLESLKHYIQGRYQFCYHFPRIYGFPKRCKLAFKRFFGRIA